MGNQIMHAEESIPSEALRRRVVQLARQASVELNVQDAKHLTASRDLLSPGTRIYISHLPGQSFDDTLCACVAAKSVGFEPIPHVPVRILRSRVELCTLIDDAVSRGVEEMLLIAGDYAATRGPFSEVAEVLDTGELRSRGLNRVSLGGHPEGHPKVSLQQIRAAELQKARMAREAGIQATFVTQFFFEAEPFLSWAKDLKSAGVTAGIRAGLSGPAHLTTLFKFALRCGVGPSVRALGARPAKFAKLLGVHGPELLLARLAQDDIATPASFQGIHLFCFGGFLRTCQWLHRVASGRFAVTEGGSLQVSEEANR